MFENFGPFFVCDHSFLSGGVLVSIATERQKSVFLATKMMFPDGRIEIYDEPSSMIKRFRYKSEGRSVPLEGVRSTPTARTLPSIRVVNYTGKARVVVSCVTADEPHR